MSKTLKATLAGLLGYGIYGFSFLFTKVALNNCPPFVMLAVRFTLAFLILSIPVVCGRIRISLRGKPTVKLLIMGFVQPVLYFITESYGIAMTSASLSGVIIGLVPVVGIIFGVLFLREKCSVFQIICTALSVGGVALTTTGGAESFSVPGFVLLIASVISTTTFAIINRSVADKFTPFERTYVMTALGSICFTVIGLFTEGTDINVWISPLKNTDVLVSILYLAVVSSIFAFTLINYTLNHLTVGYTLIFSNFTSVISVVAGVLILGENFTSLQMCGVCVIIASVFAVSLYNLKKDKRAPKIKADTP